jgi:hypothetical protein
MDERHPQERYDLKTKERLLPFQEIKHAFTDEGFKFITLEHPGGDDIEDTSLELSDYLKTAQPVPEFYTKKIFLDREDKGKIPSRENFKRVYENMQTQSAKIFIKFLAEIMYKDNLFAEDRTGLAQLDYRDYKLDVCGKAELYFTKYLELGNIKGPFARAAFDVITDNGRAVGLMKRGDYLGVSNSTLTLEPVIINEVTIPAGSIVSTVYERNEEQEMGDRTGFIRKAQECGFKFFRLSHYTFPPEERLSVLGKDQYDTFKKRSDDYGFHSSFIDTKTIEDFKREAERHLNS